MVPLVEQEYIPEEKCALFIHMNVSQVVWTPLVGVVLSCLLVSQVVCYLVPLEPGIGAGIDHNLLQQIL